MEKLIEIHMKQLIKRKVLLYRDGKRKLLSLCKLLRDFFIEDE
jgi:hypothetical protein